MTAPAEPLRPPRCPACEYDLAGVPGSLCPECGGDIAAEFLARGEAKPIAPILIPLVLGALGWGLGSFTLIVATAYWTGGMFSPDPVSLGVHGMTMATGGAAFLAVVFRRRLRRARHVLYQPLAVISVLQAVAIAILWLMFLSR